MSWLAIILGVICVIGENVASAGNCEQVLSDGSCVRAWYRFGPGMNFAKASAKCAKRGGSVAIIKNEDDYNTIVDYLRPKIPNDDWTTTSNTWIGVEVDTSTGEVTKPSPGEEVFIKWDPEEGQSAGDALYSDWTNVYLQVNKDPQSEDQGMINFSPFWSLDGVLCQFTP